MRLTATCVLGLEELLADELRGLDAADVRVERGAVTFRGDTWRDVYRANWRLRTANRVLVELATWPAADADTLTRGAEAVIASQRDWAGLAVGELFHPAATFAIRATSTASKVRDVRWVGLKVKDGLVDGQRKRFGRRASVDRKRPDLQLRVRLHQNRATLLLDTSGDSLDHRGYRVETVAAPVREQLAAACVLAGLASSGKNKAGSNDDAWRHGPVVDPMCGSGTLLAEAAAIALGRAPGRLRLERGTTAPRAATEEAKDPWARARDTRAQGRTAEPQRLGWAFERLPGYSRDTFAEVRRENISAPNPSIRLAGADLDIRAIHAARANLERAELDERATLAKADAFTWAPPAGPGLLLVNPPYGERLDADPRESWKKLGDLFKQRYAGWRAVVLAGDAGRGKHIGLRPSRRLPVKNGPLDARILVFDLY